MLTGLQCSTIVDCLEAVLNEVARCEDGRANVMKVLEMIAAGDVGGLEDKVRGLGEGGYRSALVGMVQMLDGKKVPFNLEDLNPEVTPGDVKEYVESLLAIMRPSLESCAMPAPSQPLVDVLEGFLSVFSAAAHPVQTVQTLLANPHGVLSTITATCQTRPLKALSSTGVLLAAAYYTASAVAAPPKEIPYMKSPTTLVEPSPAPRAYYSSSEAPTARESTEALHPSHIRFLESSSSEPPRWVGTPSSSLPSSKNDLVCTTGAVAAKRAITATIRKALR
eukprot:TRINITY_DN302_c0_g3_i2.p1 TRINITY_DN302_c0_g3~~TRINITY_DN302_c0_g3_i2.p1  ORF type:complete len:279 (+),score=53.31 TRINITY_DN302_c0_g3_i2:58-894(+)